MDAEELKEEFPFFKAYAEGVLSEEEFLDDVGRLSEEIAAFNISQKHVILLGHFERHKKELNALYEHTQKEATRENEAVFYGDVEEVKKHLLAIRDLLKEMESVIGGLDHPIVSKIITYCKDTLLRLQRMGFPQKDLGELNAAFQ